MDISHQTESGYADDARREKVAFAKVNTCVFLFYQFGFLLMEIKTYIHHKITSRYTRTARYRWHILVYYSCHPHLSGKGGVFAPLAGELIVSF